MEFVGYERHVAAKGGEEYRDDCRQFCAAQDRVGRPVSARERQSLQAPRLCLFWSSLSVPLLLPPPPPPLLLLLALAPYNGNLRFCVFAWL